MSSYFNLVNSFKINVFVYIRYGEFILAPSLGA